MSLSGLRRLAALSEAPARRIIGLMSGTSLDGLDIAVCRLTGCGFSTRLELEKFVTVPYTDAFRRSVLGCFAKRQVDLQELTLLHVEIAEHHAELILGALGDWGMAARDVDLIASHGQTIYHAPRSLHGAGDRPHGTLQLGDGDHLAVRTGIATVSDFRLRNIAGGGEGAPLAAYGDLLLLSDPSEDRVLLNIGGIANITCLPATDGGGKAFCSDLGPGNTLMDAAMRRFHPTRTFDEDAAVAKAGTVDDRVLEQLLQDRFLSEHMPKTTGPEHFSLDRVLALAADLALPDLLATLNRFSARVIAQHIERLPGRPALFLSGGGAHNPLLRQSLSELLPNLSIGETSALGIDPDAKEAILFAVLANELVAGDPSVFEGRIVGAPPVSMGKISLPT
jgi:anhydro-N-acetylmuramic acid kinase